MNNKLEIIQVTQSAICPKCGQYNALLLEYRPDLCNHDPFVVVCRNCKYAARPLTEQNRAEAK